MTSIFTVHGHRFTAEGHGFRTASAEADKERGLDLIETRLKALSAAEVAALHAADVAWILADCAGPRPALMDEIELAAKEEATRGWYRADDAGFSVAAAP